ncbi:MAG: epimerase [Crocinitomicaceae bacterium]|nr:epimerase [Crocinitomicaceae bacterium]|tara:strand:+ start:231 stop:1178 length:948 start_codon:yes stop_codon:yes gene_type:complete
MIKILITGGAGNVGGALARTLVENKNYYVVIADDLSTGSKEKLPSKEQSNWDFVYCDVNQYKEISEIMLVHKFDYVFHYAAVVGVKRTQDNPIMVLNDIEGIRNILQLSKNTSVKRVFFSSSSEVYGEPVELPQHEETTPLNSRVPYAVVKNVGESYFRSFFKSFGLPFTIFRFFNTYGPNQSKDFVVSRFLSLALKNQDITIYGDGLQTRTFCYVSDNVGTCVKIFEENLAINDVINIGGAQEMTILELANLIIKKTNSSSKIIHLPALKEGDMRRRMPDNSKMKTILGKELITIEEGIDLMIGDKDFINQCAE